MNEKDPDVESNSDTDQKQKKEAIRKLIDNVEELPSLPPVIQRINDAIDRPGSTAEDVGEVLKTEPSLVTKILKMINSAYFGLRRRITSISEAVVYLGYETVRNLALNASVVRMTDQTARIRKFENYDFSWKGFWKKSVATGIATETLAREIRIPDHEAAMPAGTLHMLGVLVLRSKLPRKFQMVLDTSRNQDLNYYEAEREVLGTNSPDIASWLSENWDLPQDILIGLANWLQPTNAPADHQIVPLLVHTGERLARARKVGWNPVKQIQLSNAILQELNISTGQFEDILNQYRRDLKDAEIFMEICEELD